MNAELAVIALLQVGAAGSARPVDLTAPDGALIRAHEYGKGDRGVVLGHGGRFTKESWQKQASILADNGYRVVAIDFRGFGESPRPATGAEDVHLDVLAAVSYLRGAGARTVSVVGGSFGGGAAARATVEAAPGEIDRVVLLAHSAIAEPERMRGRKLFIVARDDPSASGAPRLVKIREQFDRALEPKRLVILEGSAHAQFLFETDQGERLMQEILRFLSEP